MVSPTFFAALAVLTFLTGSSASRCRPSSSATSLETTSDSTTSASTYASSSTETESLAISTTTDITTTTESLSTSASSYDSTSTTTTATEPEVTNLVVNGDFEGAPPTIDPWKVLYNQAVITLEDDPAYAWQSKHSLRVSFTGGNSVDFVYQDIDGSLLEPDKLYLFTSGVRFHQALDPNGNGPGCHSAKAYCFYGGTNGVGTADQVFAQDAIDSYKVVDASCQFTQDQLDQGVRVALVFVCQDSYGWIDKARFVKE
ncbi:hypothetical protein NM208_g15740 [Fusarium decemcellulare]|uniref:Uncharacterized protein n=1 Tax=Fusarium decemcellulare TaxID=57161 RepID=A0ACC1RC65_9HYPO|nr:hypothetical protein NM208_g15740 [Fusarium decemcellulare]